MANIGRRKFLGLLMVAPVVAAGGVVAALSAPADLAVGGTADEFLSEVMEAFMPGSSFEAIPARATEGELAGVSVVIDGDFQPPTPV